MIMIRKSDGLKQDSAAIPAASVEKVESRRPPIYLLFLFVTAFLLVQFACQATAAENEEAFYRNARKNMVRTQLEPNGISDTATLRAMGSVPRHCFVSERLARYAYDDGPLPIDYGQTISQPFIVAYMTQLVRPRPQKRILEIGTGSGYQAAILAEIGASVYTVEIIPELARSAVNRLRCLGYAKVRVKTGDGYFGWEEHAPYDAIVVTAAAEYIPPPLLAQLKEGGRMVIPIGSPFFVQTLMLVEKRNKKTVTRSLMPVRFVPFRRVK